MAEPIFVSGLNLAPYDIHMRLIHHIQARITRPGMRVLDVGCNTGELGEQYRLRFGCHVVGIEFEPEAARFAEGRLDQVICGDLGAVDALPIPRQPFDFVVAADVLEHLMNPHETIRKLVAFLRPGGHLLISVPNVANYANRLALLAGRFDYDSNWILARSHLRFFNLREARLLITGAETVLETVDASPGLFTFKPYHATIERVFGRWPWYRRLEWQLSRRLPNLLAYQFILVGRRQEPRAADRPREDSAYWGERQLRPVK